MQNLNNGSSLKTEILKLSLLVEADGVQRAVEYPICSWEEAGKLVTYAKQVIKEYNTSDNNPIIHTRPWRWRKESGGKPLTQHGLNNGYELRLSHYGRKPNIKKEHVKPSQHCEKDEFQNFDALFDYLAHKALQRAGFPAERPREGGRLPAAVKQKVVSLWNSCILYPAEAPASFRLKDGKGGGPYNWFSYFNTTQTISPNWEYFVQLAAFHDLLTEYGYPPEWLKFEYNESVSLSSLAIDIGVFLPDGQKLFVEVKERRAQWETLIKRVKDLGHRGVDLSTPDRGNDPLRKAKYIVAGRPDFFVGYCPEGFEVYKVIYSPDSRFILEPSILPKANNGSLTAGCLKGS